MGIFSSRPSSQVRVDYKAAKRSLACNCSADWARVAVTSHVDSLSEFPVAIQRISRRRHQFLTRVCAAQQEGRKVFPCEQSHTGASLENEHRRRRKHPNGSAGLLLVFCFNVSPPPFGNLLVMKNGTPEPFEGGIIGIAAGNGVEAAFDAFLTAIGELDYDSIPGM